MANVDMLRAQLLDAQVTLQTKHYEKDERYKALHSHLKAVLEKNIDKSVAKVACSSTGAIVMVANHTIDLYFELPWQAEEGRERMLKMNFGCFGSFSKDDNAEIKYCEVLGHLAGIMDVLERQLFKTDTAKKLWSDYEAASHAHGRAQDRIRQINSEINAVETALKKERIASRIAVGLLVTMKNPSRWQHDPIVKTIEHVTSKNILFKEDYGTRTKKEDFINNVLSGNWTIA